MLLLNQWPWHCTKVTVTSKSVGHLAVFRKPQSNCLCSQLFNEKRHCSWALPLLMCLRFPLVLPELWDLERSSLFFWNVCVVASSCHVKQRHDLFSKFMCPIIIWRECLLHNIPSLHSFLSILLEKPWLHWSYFCVFKSWPDVCFKKHFKGGRGEGGRRRKCTEWTKVEKMYTIFVLGKVWDRPQIEEGSV